MRAGGINWVAALAAAIAIYAIGFVIYGLLIPAETWMAWEGVSEAETAAVAESRMMFSPIMPLMTAIFLAFCSNGDRWPALARASAGQRSLRWPQPCLRNSTPGFMEPARSK